MANVCGWFIFEVTASDQNVGKEMQRIMIDLCLGFNFYFNSISVKYQQPIIQDAITCTNWPPLPSKRR